MYVARRLRKDYPKEVVGIYDYGDKVVDRYTVVFEPYLILATTGQSVRLGKQYGRSNGIVYWPYLAMNAYPFSPQGFGQSGEIAGSRPGTNHQNNYKSKIQTLC
jgi:hypothetical protein